MTLPPVTEEKYNKQKHGYFGELGHGANARIRFLQSAVTKDELDNITLIENIPGSDRWDIRDLFQRDVDMKRVEYSILPYLKDPARVKFFNPLTLVLLPINPATGAVDAHVPYIEPVAFKKGDHEYTRHERQGLFSYEVHNRVPAFSELHWNDTKVKLVAIDGQHRLSALKFWKNAAGEKDLDTWQIPVVILGIFRADDDPSHVPSSLLEIVRKTFVYINSRAETVNEARLILLDDEKVAAVCTQHLVQQSHWNDCQSDDKRDSARLPLLFFDWRGQVTWHHESEEVTAPGSVLSIVEIRDWLVEYILGDEEKIVLQLEDLDPPLSETYRERGVLEHKDSAVIRRQFGAIVYPGLSRLLEQFEPFRKYVEKVRTLEKVKTQQSEAAGYAFAKLRFGSHPALLGQMKSLVDDSYASILDQLRKLQEDCFDELVDRDIGKRGLVYAYAALKETRDDFLNRTATWEEHTEWFIPRINAVYRAGWFKAYAHLKKEQAKILTHICFDASGSIINYKVGDVPKALGSLLALLVASQGLGDFSAEQQAELWDDYGDALDTTLRKGFRREQKARLKDTFKGTQAEFIAEVNKRADKCVADRLVLIRATMMGAGA